MFLRSPITLNAITTTNESEYGIHTVDSIPCQESSRAGSSPVSLDSVPADLSVVVVLLLQDPRVREHHRSVLFLRS
jgi:hypothetical protein